MRNFPWCSFMSLVADSRGPAVFVDFFCKNNHARRLLFWAPQSAETLAGSRVCAGANFLRKGAKQGDTIAQTFSLCDVSRL